MIVWSALPPKLRSVQLTFSSSDLQRLIGQVDSLPAPEKIPAYQLLLAWPGKIRVGEIQEIHLVFQPETGTALQGQTPENNAVGAGLAEDESTPPVLSIVGRLESPTLSHLPAGQISQKLSPGQPVSFSWRVQPAQAQAYQGTVWIYLGIAGSGHELASRQVLAAQEISIIGTKFLGLDSLAARLIGSLGAAIGAVLSLDKILVDLILRLRKKLTSQV